MATVYSISDRKEKIISHIMRDERLTYDRREQIAKTLFNLKESDQFVLQDSNSPKQVCFPHLNLFSKQANISTVSLQELKSSTHHVAHPLYPSDNGQLISTCEKPIFVESAARRNKQERMSVGVILSQLKQ